MSEKVVLTDIQRQKMLEATRKGVSARGAAHLVGRSGSWLDLVKKQHPDFAQEMLEALAQVELTMSEAITDAINAGNPGLIAALVKVRSNRFPQRHGEDPKLRYAMDVAGEEHTEDLPNARAQDQGISREARNAILDEAYRLEALEAARKKRESEGA